MEFTRYAKLTADVETEIAAQGQRSYGHTGHRQFCVGRSPFVELYRCLPVSVYSEFGFCGGQLRTSHNKSADEEPLMPSTAKKKQTNGNLQRKVAFYTAVSRSPVWPTFLLGANDRKSLH